MTAEIERCPHCRARSINVLEPAGFAQFLGEYWAMTQPKNLDKYIRSLHHMDAHIPTEYELSIKERWEIKAFVAGLERGRDEYRKNGSASHG